MLDPHSYSNSVPTPRVDPGVLSQLIRNSNLDTDVIASMLEVESIAFYRWRTAILPIPSKKLKPLADALGATIQDLLQLAPNTLVDMQQLREGRLVIFDKEHPRGLGREDDAEPIQMIDHTHQPLKRMKAQFGMDGMLMGPRTAAPTICSCGRSLDGK